MTPNIAGQNNSHPRSNVLASLVTKRVISSIFKISDSNRKNHLRCYQKSMGL